MSHTCLGTAAPELPYREESDLLIMYLKVKPLTQHPSDRELFFSFHLAVYLEVFQVHDRDHTMHLRC